MNIVKVPIESLQFDPSNARKHPDKNMSAIKGSISKFGQVEPLIVKKDTKVIIGGNGRLAAMKELGFKEVEIVELDITNTEATALAIALNRTGELAEWNMDILEQLVEQLKNDNFSLDAIGFSDADLLGFGGDPNYQDDPEVPFSEEVGPLDHYMIIMFENSEQYEKYSKLFGIERVKSNISGSGHANFFRFGDGRVLKFDKLKDKIHE